MAEHPDVTLVKRGYAAFSAGDGATLSEIIAPDATQYQPGNNQMAGTHEGLEAILTFYGQLAAETNGTFQVQLEHALSDGQGHVVAIQRVTAQRQGRTLDSYASLVFTISDGKAQDIHGYEEDFEAWDAFWG
jgi:ketosteroid isomerase-like protein